MSRKKKKISAISNQKSAPLKAKRTALISSELDPNDPAAQEERAFLDLFRSINIGRLIAVIGSGVTIPYGYDSWDAFCDKLVDFFEYIEKNSDKNYLSKSGHQFCNQYTLTSAFFRKLNAEEKRIICGSIFVHLTDEGKKYLYEKYKEWFGFPDRYKTNNVTIEQLFRKNGVGKIPISLRKEGYLPSDLGKLLELYLKQTEQSHKLDFFLETKKSFNIPSNRISAPRSLVDPLFTLRSSLRITRFATFNYDNEIEAMLEDLDYPYNTLTSEDKDSARETQSRLGANARSISLSRENASELIGLAAMPSSDDTLIVHLHGAANKPEDMVVTPRDYNRLYIDGYSSRKSFDDARNLMFGGNAILYVGVGLSEEDLMRPLRYLSSTLPDRPIYALVPSLESELKDRVFVQKIKENYGVNAIIYGRSSEKIPTPWEPNIVRHPLSKRFPFIENFNALYEELNHVRSAINKLFNGEPVEIDDLLSPDRAPRLNCYEEFVFILRNLKVHISRNNQKRDGEIATIYKKQFIHLVKSLAQTAHLGLPATRIGNYKIDIDLTMEIANIKIEIEKNREDPIFLKYALDNGNFPRLINHPVYIAASHLLETISGNTSKDKKLFINFFESVVISTALNHVLEYMSESANIWRKKWDVDRAGMSYLQKSPTVLHNSKPRQLTADEDECAEKIFAKIINNIASRVEIIHFKTGSGKGTFMSYIGHLMENDPAYEIHIYSMDHIVDPNSILHRILHLIKPEKVSSNGTNKKNRIVFLRNAERLLSADGKNAQNLLVLKLFHYFKMITDAKIVFIVNKIESAFYISKYYGIEFIPGSISNINNGLRVDVKQSIEKNSLHSIHRITKKYNWPNKVLNGVTISITNSEKLHLFLLSCNNFLEPRLSKNAPEYHRSIFCESIIDTQHRWVRQHGTPRDRVLVVIEHAILKWMFTIHIPICIEIISTLEEINEIKIAYDEIIGRDFLGIIKSALSKLEECGLIFPVYSRDQYNKSASHNSHYILHNETRRYLAHKRGLSYGWMDHREWNTATVCNAIMGGNPLFNEKDYVSTCRQFEGFIDRFYEDTEMKRSLRCAYALVRGHLHAHNAIRAGFSFPVLNTKRGVLEEHIGRLSKLRSATKEIAKARRPPLYENYDLWLLNEIGVMRYIQGDFHDSVMLFRNLLDFCDTTESTYFSEDPSLVSRIRINLALSLVERARFDESLRLLDSVDNSFKEMSDEHFPTDSLVKVKEHDSDDFIPSNQPESLLLLSVAYGCRAQIEILTAKLDQARTSINAALTLSRDIDIIGVRGWLYGIDAMQATAVGDISHSRQSLGLALAAARGSLRPDLIMNLEIAQAEFQIRDSKGNREIAISILADLTEIEKNAYRIGSYKARVSILLIRARILLYLQQFDSARKATLDAISLSLLNGMRLKRISGLILMSAIMFMRGEHDPARKLLRRIRMTAASMRYIRAVFDLDRLERAMDTEGGVILWAGYQTEFDVSLQKNTHSGERV